MLVKIIFYSFLLLINILQAEELKTLDTTPKYNFSICAIFKNEAKNLDGWLKYHLNLGIDHFYLYNIGSSDSYIVVLNPYIKKGIVTLMNWPEIIVDQNDENSNGWMLSTQIPAYENAVNLIARNETIWLMLADVSDFLVCPKGNIKNILNTYGDLSAISLFSDFINEELPRNSVHKQRFIQLVEPSIPPSQNGERQIAKMIFKPDHCIGFIWPPYQCRFSSEYTPIEIDREELRINHYINRENGYSPFENKIEQGCGVDHRILSQKEAVLLLKEGYVIEDREKLIYLQVPPFLKKVQLGIDLR